MWNVLLPSEIDPAGPKSLSDIAQCKSMSEYDNQKAALETIDEFDALIVRVAEVDSTVIDRADRLKVIAKHGSGLDNIDIQAASNRDIIVCNTPGANSRSVGEHTIALLFGVCRQLCQADRDVRAGNWNRSAFTGNELRGKTLGLLGFGDIAQETAKIANALNMEVIAYDPYVSMSSTDVEKVDKVSTLFELANVASIHVPLTESTRNMISIKELKSLGENGIFLNTSRGGIVEKGSLHRALENNDIAGAGIDTFRTEPPGKNHPLYEHENVLLTPHIGGVTDEALVRMSEQSAENVRKVHEGNLPSTTVNREALSTEVVR